MSTTASRRRSSTSIRDTDRWGDIWSVFVPGIGAGQLYHFQADGPFDPERGQRFDRKARLIDPYARALAGDFLPADDGIIRPPKCVVVDDYVRLARRPAPAARPVGDGDLRDARPRLHAASPSSGVEHPGTYLGVIEKIPYLKSLGVTAVELMPVHEFPTNGFWGEKPKRAELLGLRFAGVLLAAPRLRRRQRAGRQVQRVQGDGASPAPGGHRSDSRRRVQPHGRRQRARPDAELQGAGEPASTTCSTTAAATTRTTRAAATRSTAITRSSAR